MTKVSLRDAGSMPELLDRIGADHEQSTEVAVARGVEDFGLGEAGCRGQAGIFVCERAGRGDRDVAGKQVGEQTHVGGAAGVGVIAEKGKAHIAALQAPGDEGCDLVVAAGTPARRR